MMEKVSVAPPESQRLKTREEWVDHFVYELGKETQGAPPWVFDQEKRAQLHRCTNYQDLVDAVLSSGRRSETTKRIFGTTVAEVTSEMFGALKEAVSLLEKRGAFGITVEEVMRQWEAGELVLNGEGIYLFRTHNNKGGTKTSWIGTFVKRDGELVMEAQRRNMRQEGKRTFIYVAHDEFSNFCIRQSIQTIVYRSQKFKEAQEKQLTEVTDATIPGAPKKRLAQPVSAKAEAGTTALDATKSFACIRRSLVSGVYDQFIPGITFKEGGTIQTLGEDGEMGTAQKVLTVEVSNIERGYNQALQEKLLQLETDAGVKEALRTRGIGILRVIRKSVRYDKLYVDKIASVTC